MHPTTLFHGEASSIVAPSAGPAPFAVSNLRSTSKLTPRIVIVGGGAGGLELAARLGHDFSQAGAAGEVILVDSGLVHLWKPALHELAAGTLQPDDVGMDYLQLARRHGFGFHMGTLAGLDRSAREIWLDPLTTDDGLELAPRRAIAYDVLVIAIGSIVDDFGVPGVTQHALSLNQASDADRFHKRLLALVARAEMLNTGPVNLVIVGGGATGVELAAELAEVAPAVAEFGCRLRQLGHPLRLRIVESGARLVSALPEGMATKIQQEMQERGVELLLNRRVVSVAADHVVLDDGERLPSDLTVWAAGIKGPAVLEQLDGLALNGKRQLLVHPSLQTTMDDNIYAIGDCASCVQASGDPVPPKAQAAQQQARHLAQALRARFAGETYRADFTFRDRGSLVSLGSQDAVGQLASTGHGLRLQGLIARVAYWTLYRRHMAALVGIVRTTLATVGSWLLGRSQPRVKLH
jgi:NADH dehydrogenase